MTLAVLLAGPYLLLHLWHGVLGGPSLAELWARAHRACAEWGGKGGGGIPARSTPSAKEGVSLGVDQGDACSSADIA